jgi:anaerobic magnesium-protoporphyrin IX monomethyl ester cyclase
MADSALDLLLINTPIHDYATYPRFEATHTAPLGLLSIATHAQLSGFRVEVYDAEFHQADREQLCSLVRSLRPRWVGLNCFSVNISVLRKIVDAIAELPTQVLVGGPHISNVSDEHLRSWFSNADTAVRGDAEAAVVSLLRGAPIELIPGAVNLTGNAAGASVQEPAQNLDLAELALIDRSLSKGEPVPRFDRRWFSMTMSRGCVFRCKFCAGSSHSSGRPYRTAPISIVMRELEYLKTLGGDGIRLVDDLPFKGKQSLLAFLEQVHNNFGDHFVWDVNFPLQYCLTMDQSDWEKAHALGLETVTFGVEAADEVLRSKLGKRSTDLNLFQTINSISSVGIDLKLYFIIGTPGETAESSLETTELAIHLADRPTSGPQVRCSLFVYKPMPGSALWGDLLDQGYSEEQLLGYTDFELEVRQFQKHAWQSSLWLAELRPQDLAALVDRFYSETEAGLPDRNRPNAVSS